MNEKLLGTLIDQKMISKNKNYTPFIYTDLLTTFAGEKNCAFFHFWQLEQHVILGMKDTRVPDLKRGLKAINQLNYQAVVRNSGGLAVVSDEGILNFTLILPHEWKNHLHSIEEGYLMMKEIIQLAFQDQKMTIESFEVSDSYCPGEFDLSINGYKFAGIAQRRVKKGIAIMIYLSVFGEQGQRGKLIENFYRQSLGDNFGKDGYPPVRPDSMANLNDLLKTNFSIEEVKKRIEKALSKKFDLTNLKEHPINDYLDSDVWQIDFDKQQTRMEQRNTILTELKEE